MNNSNFKKDLGWFKQHKLLTLLGAILVLVIIAAVVPPPEESKKEAIKQPPKMKALEAEVNLAEDVPGIEVTNKERVAWQNCRIEINDEFERQIRNPLQPNEPLNNPYGLFTRGDGARFDPITHAVKDIFIICDVNGQRRSALFHPTN